MKVIPLFAAALLAGATFVHAQTTTTPPTGGDTTSPTPGTTTPPPPMPNNGSGTDTGTSGTGNTTDPSGTTGTGTTGQPTDNGNSGSSTMQPSTNGDTTGGAQPGANSFTEEQARARIEAAGYTEVGALTKSDDGIWKGPAKKNGMPVQVSVDYQGNVTEM